MTASSAQPPPTSDGAAPLIDTSVPHPARRYNYWLGGKDNFAADRASADAVAEAHPFVRTAAVENRGFLLRAVEHLAAQGVNRWVGHQARFQVRS